MTVAESVIKYLNSLSSIETLFADPLFSIGILRLMDDATTRLIFDLVIASTHISHLRDIEGIKESISTMVQIGLVGMAEGIVSLNGTFRGALLHGFCLASLDKSFVEIDPRGIDKRLEKYADAGGAPGTMDELRRSVATMADEKFQFLLQTVVNKATNKLFAVKEILVFCNLIDNFNQITNKGFEFLLKSRREQLWFVVISSIKYFSKSMEMELEMLDELMEMCVKRNIKMYRKTGISKWHLFLDSVGIIEILEQVDSGDERGGKSGRGGKNNRAKELLG